MNPFDPKYFKFIICILSLLVASAALILGSNLSHSQEISITKSPVPTGTPLAVQPSIDLLAKINQAVSLLQQSAPLQYQALKTRRNITPTLVRKQIALAIMDTVTGTIMERRFWLNEAEIKKAAKTGIVTLTPVDDTVDTNVQVRWWNSFNSLYDIPDHPTLLVLANKYLLPSSNLKDLPEQSKQPFSDIVYVPYSRAFQTPEIIKAGQHYLETQVNTAYTQFDTMGIRSRFDPSLPMSQAIPKDLIKSIILIEHIDPGQFALATDNGEDLTKRVLTIIGTNQERAFRYTGSPAGANGLAQFIEPTYKAMVKKYPEVNLFKSYSLGMADHINAIKAMVLFFDSHKKSLQDGIERDYITQQLGITEEMLAAAYNGGPNKVARSVNKYGLAWLNNQLTPEILRQETIDYLKKFQAIRHLNLF